MPYVKCISGHTSARFIQRYLEKNDRALATDFVNIDVPVKGVRAGLEDYEPFDWWCEMDQTRSDFGNDTPWNGQRARTWKHYILSPNPDDDIDLGMLRRLTVAWAQENFNDYEVAIIYHDDNANRIPHAHVVVNNTNLATGYRLQEPDPRAVKRSIQKLAKGMGLSWFEDAPHPEGAKRVRSAASKQRVHVGRAERELEDKGEYSWVGDIRARVSIARMVARNEDEFRSVLKAMGLDVKDNSTKASRRDWIYSFDDRPTLRVSGEKMGLSFGKEHLSHRFSSGSMGCLADATEREVFRIASKAYEVGDIAGLKKLSDAVSVCEALGARSIDDLIAAESRPPRGLNSAKLAAAIEYMTEKELLPTSRMPVIQESRRNAQQKPWEKNQPNWMKDRKSNDRRQEQPSQRQQCDNRDRGNRDAR
ncbi:relaxase/mobilization nuclease domain-containing protein [Slackia exigua]|uniref:relaxase/mobilization nuclease domain-containing protein n=1 Tax=Slackia exigua TaxID=84109 RepID=UPI002108EF84|nr:relaxase/mobilization nuclease domain-containing protein [Slackia exigua]MCQ5091311.1 relaxase/mobilization nuclease domain-containing protein [Slackia exigua]